MPESANDSGREAFRVAIERARADGLSFDDLANLITTAANDERSGSAADSAQPNDVVYERGQLPEGLIDLPSAARKYGEEYGVSADAMGQWVRRGRVAKAGLLRAPAPGGGYLVVRELELLEYMRRPRNKGGRPGRQSV